MPLGLHSKIRWSKDLCRFDSYPLDTSSGLSPGRLSGGASHAVSQSSSRKQDEGIVQAPIATIRTSHRGVCGEGLVTVG